MPRPIWICVRWLGAWKGRSGPVEGQALDNGCDDPTLQPEIHQRYSIRTLGKSPVIRASGLVEGLTPVDVSGVHGKAEHVTSHRVLISHLKKNSHLSRDVRRGPSRIRPEHVTEPLNFARDLLSYPLRRRQVLISDVAGDIEWISGYRRVLVVYTRIVVEQERVRCWFDHLHNVRNKLDRQVPVLSQVEDPLHERCIWKPHGSNILCKSQNTVKLHLNSAYIVVVGATARETVGEKSTTDTFSSVRIDDLVADPQGLEDHGSVQSSHASTDDTNR